MTLNEAAAITIDSYQHRITTHWRSKPGMGKNETIEECVIAPLAEQYNEPFGLHVVHLSTMDGIDVRGIPMPTEIEDKGNRVMVSKCTRSDLMPPLNAPRRGLVFLDEVMQVQDQSVLKPVARFVWERKIGEYSLPPGWGIVMASNRATDKSGVSRGLAFFTNRTMVLPIHGDLDTWVQWAVAHEINPMIIGFAKYKSGTIFNDDVPDDPDQPFLTPRSLVQCGKSLSTLDNMTLCMHATSGLIGDGSAAELIAFIEVANELPDFEVIVRNPEGTKVPKASDAQYAVTQMLAHEVSPATAVPVFKYLSRLSKEFQVMCLRDAMLRPNAQSLMANEEFAKWIQKNSQLVLTASGMPQ
jgi:hypothetical protein